MYKSVRNRTSIIRLQVTHRFLKWTSVKLSERLSIEDGMNWKESINVASPIVKEVYFSLVLGITDTSLCRGFTALKMWWASYDRRLCMMHRILIFFGFIRNSKLHELWTVPRYFPVKWSWSLTRLSCGWNTLLHIWHVVALSKSRCCCTVSFFIGNFFLRKCLTLLATAITWSKNSSATFSPRRTTGFRKKRWSLDLTYRAALHWVCNCLFSVHEKSPFSLFAHLFLSSLT